MLGYTPFPWTRGKHPPGADTSPGPEADTPQEEIPPGPEADPPPPRADTGNKRAVRILLECILVENLKTRQVGLKSLLERHHVTSEEFVIHIMQEEFLELYETS